MNTFNAASTCVKCGFGASGELQNPSQFLESKYAAFEGFGYEVIKRTCRRCGYVYYEKPIDQ